MDIIAIAMIGTLITLIGLLWLYVSLVRRFVYEDEAGLKRPFLIAISGFAIIFVGGIISTYPEFKKGSDNAIQKGRAEQTQPAQEETQ